MSWSETHDGRGAWGGGGDHFATTRWSLVAAAADGTTPEGQAALAALCQAYWLPLYAYVRRRVSSEHEARDLTQGFFAQLLERQDLANARRDRGRLRAYLLTAMKHFLANERSKQRAAKRGGGKLPLSLDFDEGESRRLQEPSDTTTPDQIFERQWVATLLELVLQRLRREAVDRGKEEQYEALKGSITGTADRGSHAEVAERLGLSEGAVRMAAQRLRDRYRKLLREEIGRTLRDPAEVDDEIAGLFAAVRPTPRIL